MSLRQQGRDYTFSWSLVVVVVVVVPVVVCCLLYAFITICFSLDINVVLFLLSDIFFHL